MNAVRRSSMLGALDDMPPAFLRALRDWEERVATEFGPARAIVHTRSDVEPLGVLRRMFRRTDHEETVAVVGTEVLILIVARNDAAPVANSVRLHDAEVTDYEQTPRHRIRPDSGVEIVGVPRHGTERQHRFLGLGPGGDAFRCELTNAVR